MRALITIIVLGLMLQGCAPLKQYHPAAPYLKSYDLDTPLASCPNDSANKADFLHGFIEFDEYGNLLNPGAFEKQMADIRAVNGPLLLVTYLHGWRHSAAPDDDDVREFKLAMRNIAAMDGCKRTVIGLYMGWRGQVFAWNSPLDLITFWDRKQTAHSVGNGAVTEVLLRLDKERVRRNNNSQLQAMSNTQTRLVFIGHSFGAAVLYTALAPILVERFTQSSGFDPANELSTTGCEKNPREPLKTVGDLVVLINPAFEAMRLATLQKMSMGCHYTEHQAPVVAIVTGTTDLSTKWAFHIARAPRARFQKYTDDVVEGYSANSTAVGHYEPYQTHFLSSPNFSLDNADRQTFNGCEQYIDPLKSELRISLTTLSASEPSRIVRFTSQQKQMDGSQKFFDLQLEKNPQLKNSPDHNPVLNINVSAPIIDGHGGIYSCQLMTFIGGLITQTITN